MCHINVIIYVSFEDVLASFSLQRLNFSFDLFTHVYGLAELFILSAIKKRINVNKFRFITMSSLSAYFKALDYSNCLSNAV